MRSLHSLMTTAQRRNQTVRKVTKLVAMRKSTIAIVLLLMLAIPFQGFAAAAMQSGLCAGPSSYEPGRNDVASA